MTFQKLSNRMTGTFEKRNVESSADATNSQCQAQGMSRTVSHYDERPESKVDKNLSLVSDGVTSDGEGEADA